MHGSGITLSLSQEGSTWEGKAVVKVVYNGGNPVKEAMVGANWALNGVLLSTTTALANGRGEATVVSERFQAARGSVVNVAVTSVSRAGYIYDSAANVKSDESAFVP